MQAPAEGLGTQLAGGEGSLLVGDLGLVVIKALLENGVGYVVTGWTDPANPVDAAIEDCRRGVLERAGVLLRRLRRFDHIATTIQSPGMSATFHEGPMRGLVVWNGRSGLRPALERFCDVEVPGPVVGLCFDEDAARSAGLPLIDPEPTPQGLVGAIDRAFGLSAAIGRPTLVLIRERTLGMRGVLRCRDNIRPVQAHALDAASAPGSPDEVVDRLGINDAGDPEAAGALVVVAASPLRGAVRAAIPRVVAGLRAAGAGDVADRLGQATVAEVGTPGVPGVAICAAVDRASCTIVVEDRGTRVAALLDEAVPAALVARAPVHIGMASVDEVAAALLSALGEAFVDEVPAATLNAAASDLHVARDTVDELVGPRLPRRGASLHRPLPEPVAAGLLVAQASIGVPARIDDEHPSYRTDGGATLTVVTAAEFSVHGIDCAAPEARTGTFVITGGLSAATQSAAAAAGATTELVDGSRPRRLAEAIARSCVGPRPMPHVIFLAQPAPVIGNGRAAGLDTDLLGADRVSAAGMPPAAVVLGERFDDPLVAGPVIGIANAQAASAAIDAAAELSPAWHDVRSGRRRSGIGAAGRTIRRRIVRAIGGMDA